MLLHKEGVNKLLYHKVSIVTVVFIVLTFVVLAVIWLVLEYDTDLV